MEQKKSKNEDGGLKDVDVFTKVISLQCSWIRGLYDENFHEWKIIPSYLIKTNFSKNFKFHSCLEPSLRSLKNIPNFYKEMITNWTKCQSGSPCFSSAIPSQFLWFNSNIKNDNKSIFISGFAGKNISSVGQLFHKNDKTKSWDYIKSENNLESKLKYRWIQLTGDLPKLWKDRILNNIGNSMNLCIFDHHHLIKNLQLIFFL